MKSTIETIRLLIVDDHQMVRDGIKVMLELQNNIAKFMISEADTGEEAVNKVLHNDFDIVLMDYQLPKMSGVETVEKIKLYRRDLKILVLSNYDEVTYINKMLSAGANGYILKNIEPVHLILAIKTILAGKPFYSNEVAIKLLEENKPIPKSPDKYRLTKRELDILKMIVREMRNEEIAQSLNISKRTVDTHRQNLLHKLNAKNTVGLVKVAFELNLV